MPIQTYIYPHFEVMHFLFHPHRMVSFSFKAVIQTAKLNDLMWEMAQWTMSVWGPDWLPYLCSIITSKILYLLCASLAFYDTYENHYTMLPCTVFYLYHYTFFLITLRFLKDWLISVFISAFCSTLSDMVVSGVFLNRSLKPEVWYLSYTKILEKLRGRKKKKEKITFSADTRIQVSTVFLKAALNIANFCSANSYPLYLWWAGRSFFKQWK